MKVYTLERTIIKWTPSGISTADNRAKSSYHQTVKDLLYEKYGRTLCILEEVSIPIRARQTAYFDFYIPLLKKAFEVHGEQHYKFIPHFHVNAQGFVKQRKRDAEKQEWCDINGIELTTLSCKEQDKWQEQI